MAGVTNPDTPHLTASLTRRRGGLRGGWAPVGPAGIPAVTVAKSAYVRAANVWPIRASNSSMVSLTLRERDLERVDHLLAVGVRRPQVAAAHHNLLPFRLPALPSRRLPRRKMKEQRNAAARWQPSALAVRSL